MPDISMCTQKVCEQKETCYRHPASGTQPHPFWQAYFLPARDPQGKCLDYWPLKATQGEKNQD